MSVRLKYGDVSPGADEKATASSTSAEALSTLSKLPFGTDDANIYATLETGLWVLDGSVTVRKSEIVSFWSTAISDNDGIFQTPPAITMSLSEAISSSGITVTSSGDCKLSSIRIKWYSGSTLLDTEVYQADDELILCNNAVENYNKIVIEVLGTSLPNRRARIDSVLFGINRTFTRMNLESANIIFEIDPSSRSLAEGVLDFLIYERTVDFIFQRRQTVMAYDDDKLMGVFYLTDAEKKSATKHEVECTDAIGLLADEPFQDTVYTGTTALAAAQAICSGYTVYMDQDLRSIQVKGILKGQSCRQALQQLCLAICAVATTWGSDGIRIMKLPDLSTADNLPAGRTRAGGTLKKRDKVTAVKVTSHSYKTSGSGNPITIGNTNYYDTQAVTTINNPDTSNQDRTNVIEVTDGTLVSPERASAVANHVLSYYMLQNTYDFKFRPIDESIGDPLNAETPWGSTVTGYFVKASIVLSGIALSDSEVIGS